MNSPTPPTALTPPASSEGGLPIAAVERETGLGKDALRVEVAACHRDQLSPEARAVAALAEARRSGLVGEREVTRP